jgi:hypothetical protein
MKLRSFLTSLIIAATGLCSVSAFAALDPFQSYTGNVAMSTDGFGSTTNSGMIYASVPSGSTVLAAYLYTATHSTGGTPGVTLGGTAVTFGPRVPNATACCSLASFRSDVTSIVAPVINGGPGGVYDFDVVETALGFNVDGSALVVVYENPALPDATVGILDGFASVGGDSTSINFSDPLNPSNPVFFAEMILGIGFSCCGQKSTVDVNGTRLTDNAGNSDDGNAQSNGSLITVGSFDDLFTPILPSYEEDTEKYDLSSFVTDGDTSIDVVTANASQDDNIFLAGFYVSGVAGFNAPPPTPTPNVSEPGTVALFGLSMFALYLRRKQK